MSNSRIPEAKYPYKHHTPVQIRFNDIDMFGHLNNSIYFQYFDLAKAEYFRQFMKDKHFDFGESTLVVVNVNCNFFSPAYYEEELEVLSTVSAISERSLTVEQRIINTRNGDVKCLCSTIMANIDPKTLKSTPITEDWKQKISDYEGRQF